LSKKKEKIIINITDLTKVRKKEKGKRYITGKDKKGKFYQEITETYNIKVQPFRK
jgi:SHS2 domain-containing protein